MTPFLSLLSHFGYLHPQKRPDRAILCLARPLQGIGADSQKTRIENIQGVCP